VARCYQHDTPETGKDPLGGFYRQRGSHPYDLRLRLRARPGVWPRTVRGVHLDEKSRCITAKFENSHPSFIGTLLGYEK
jgi:hypothetical protein